LSATTGAGRGVRARATKHKRYEGKAHAKAGQLTTFFVFVFLTLPAGVV
jgi:hypothetical protein